MLFERYYVVGHKKDFEKLEIIKYKNHLAHAKPKWDEKICVQNFVAMNSTEKLMLKIQKKLRKSCWLELSPYRETYKVPNV